MDGRGDDDSGRPGVGDRSGVSHAAVLTLSDHDGRGGGGAGHPDPAPNAPGPSRDRPDRRRAPRDQPDGCGATHDYVGKPDRSGGVTVANELLYVGDVAAIHVALVDRQTNDPIAMPNADITVNVKKPGASSASIAWTF